MGRDDEADLGRVRGESALLEEISVYHGVEEVVINGIVDVRVLVIVAPWVRLSFKGK
jgi:hypothetical protein